MTERAKREARKLELYRRFGRFLRMAREKSGLSVPELARYLRLTHSMLSRIERGERRPSMELVFEVGAKLKTRADFLLYGDLSGVDAALRRRLWLAHREELLPYQATNYVPALDQEVARRQLRPDPIAVRTTIARRSKGDTPRVNRPAALPENNSKQ